MSPSGASPEFASEPVQPEVTGGLPLLEPIPTQSGGDFGFGLCDPRRVISPEEWESLSKDLADMHAQRVRSAANARNIFLS